MLQTRLETVQPSQAPRSVCHSINCTNGIYAMAYYLWADREKCACEYLELQTVALFLRDLSSQSRFFFQQTLQTQRSPVQLELLTPSLQLTKHTNIQFHFCQKLSFLNHKYPSAPLRQNIRVCYGSLTSTRFWLRSSAMSFSSCLVCSLSCMLWAVISFWACTRSSTVTAFTPSCERGGRGVTFSTDAYTSPIWKCWLGMQLIRLWKVLPPPVWTGKGLWSSPYERDKRSVAAGLDRTVLCVSAVTREKS